MKNTKLIITTAIIILLITIVAGVIYFNYNSNTNKKLIGGDKDSHGCLIGAGYSWCESKQKCLRVFEESCAESFCLRDNVAGVYKCGDYVKVISSLIGGGVSYYTDNMTEIQCPVVGPDYVSKECKDISGLSCIEVRC